MNYLAHTFLSPKDPHILMGNIWGDILRPKDYHFLTPRIMEGINEHKMIDAFTDQHDHVEQIKMLIRPYQGKYTPVVADVIMDFILSKFWHVFHDETLENFCQKIYVVVKENLHLIPERLHSRINRMMENHWLESCANRERMRTTFLMLGRRASFENKIPDAMLPYELHEHTIDRLFLTFFDDLRAHLIPQSESSE